MDGALDLKNETPIERLARLLVDQDSEFLYQLHEERQQSGLSPQDVADRAGWPLHQVHEFERYDADPTLSEIRRYAYAIGVSYEHNLAAMPRIGVL